MERHERPGSTLPFTLISFPPTKTGQRLVQWEGMDDEEAPYLMKEFHEHLGKLESGPEKEERGRGFL